MSDSPEHPLDAAIRLEPLADGRLRGHTSEAYWNFVSPYGGVTAATVINSVLVQPNRLGDPVSLTVNFAAAMQPGEFIVSTRLLRASRSTQHWSIEITQGEPRNTTVSALAIFASRRATFGLTEATPPEAPDPSTIERTVPIETLKWLHLYDMRFVRGSPWSQQSDSLTTMWIKDVPERPLDFPALTSICDAFFPRVLLHRPRMVPLGTVSLNIYFHVDARTLAQQDRTPLLATAQANVFNEGFYDQEGAIWGSERRLLATTHQIVWYKE